MFCKADVPDRQVCFQGPRATSSSSPQKHLSLIQVRDDPKDWIDRLRNRGGMRHHKTSHMEGGLDLFMVCYKQHNYAEGGNLPELLCI